jgi:hypothetical protein
MRRAIRALVLAVITIGSTGGLAAAKDFVINPQAGMTASHRTNDPADITTSARVGYMFGGNLRFGSGKAYLAPGVYFQRANIQTTEKDTLSQSDEHNARGIELADRGWLGPSTCRRTRASASGCSAGRP